MERKRIGRVLKYMLIISAIIAVVIFIIQYIMGVVKKEKIKEMQADLLAVQAKVEIIKGKNSVNKDENPLKGISVSKVAEKINLVNKIFEKYGITGDDLANYYILRDSDLAEMDLQSLVGKNKGSYIVSYNNYEVLYTEGYTNANGLFCYKVSEMNKQPEIQKVIPVSANETQATGEESTSEETKTEETTSSETTTETTNTTESTQTSAQVNEEFANNIKNNAKKLIK